MAGVAERPAPSFRRGMSQGRPSFLKREREKAKRERQQKKAAHLKDEFIGMVSHEMRNPLTVIIGGLATVIGQEGRLSETDRSGLISSAYLGAESLVDMVNNLLTLSRKHDLSFEPVDLNVMEAEHRGPVPCRCRLDAVPGSGTEPEERQVRDLD